MPEPSLIQLDSYQKPGFFLMDDWNNQTHQGMTWIFTQPLRIIMAQSAEEILPALHQAETFLDGGYYVAGYLAYDAGFYLEESIQSRHDCQIPLLWMGVYATAASIKYDEADWQLSTQPEKLSPSELNCSDSDYLECIHKIKKYIAAGDVYQVNYTCKLKFQSPTSAWILFKRLRHSHPVCHSAYLDMGDHQILSLSPELFLRKQGNKLQTRPMKGTLSRGKSVAEDNQKAQFLREDAKNRAENLMIVDLMRNDLGRLCPYGKVSVPSLFKIEKYPTVFQMTSLVEGELYPKLPLTEVMRATFPPGSVTGAPKIRAMQIIDELEKESRGIYCGTMGFFKPDGDFLLNVAIRTILQTGSQCELGVGSGIISDSMAESELKETLLKGSFIHTPKLHSFQLLETLGFQGGQGYLFLEEHLDRMIQSADYFGWKLIKADIRESLNQLAQRELSFHSNSFSCKIRLLVSSLGKMTLSWAPLEDKPSEPVKLWLSENHQDPEDIFLYHKTTHRWTYDQELRRARERGYYEVIYQNLRGKLSEGSFTNLFFKVDGEWITPPVSSGLLPGIGRQNAIQQGKVSEKLITLQDLQRVQAIEIINSVRGRIPVSLINSSAGICWPVT